jgi:uncharacterized membrane protein YidH (DUF202 family)
MPPLPVAAEPDIDTVLGPGTTSIRRTPRRPFRWIEKRRTSYPRFVRQISGRSIGGLMSARNGPDARDEFEDPSRRTYFAEERTLLAWWRTGVGSAAVAVAVGGLLPKVGDLPRGRCIALAVGYGVLGLAFVIFGTVRDQLAREALRNNSFVNLSARVVWVFTLYTSVLVVLTVVAFL